MPAPLQRFRAFEIAEDPGGTSLELRRTDREVVCLASLPAEQRWVELHVLAGVDTQDPAARPTVEGFRAQVQALLRLRDRRVLEVLEVGEDEGALFYVSEFVDGETLDVYLARCTPLPPWWAVEIARQLTLGLLAVRAAPALLARAQVFNARLSLEGEATADALVKLADFDLGGPPDPAPPDAAAAETRAVTEVGRLLCYALSGLVAEQVSPRQLGALPLPPEVADLLARLLGRPGRPSPADLPGLLAALTASALSPSLTAAPPRLPPALRPRLPLAPHFPSLPRLATELGSRLRLERTVFDAAQPYAQRAFEGTEAVTVQLLPPPRLLTPTYLPLLRHAADRASARPTPHLLRVLEVPAHDDPGWFIEEGAPRLSLDRARRLRRHLTPAESAFLLREYDKAVLAIEARGLSPVGLSPQDIFVDFSESPGGAPGDDALASQAVHAWPAFKLKVRAHPTAVHLAQPRRFLRERLLDPCPPRTPADPPPGPPAGLGSPSAADYAALFAWMCGGLTAVPGELAPLIETTLNGTSTPPRGTVVDAVQPFIPRPPKSSPGKTQASTPGPTRKGGGSASAKSTGKARRSQPGPKPPQPTKKPAAAPPSSAPPSAANLTEPAPAATFLPLESAGAWADDGGPPEDAEPGGFAEVLLGPSTRSALLPPADELPSAFDATPDEPVEELPVGALFGSWPESPQDQPARREHGFDFSSGSGIEGGPGLWRLVTLVVLVALVIAALMAHFTGLGFWR